MPRIAAAEVQQGSWPCLGPVRPILVHILLIARLNKIIYYPNDFRVAGDRLGYAWVLSRHSSAKPIGLRIQNTLIRSLIDFAKSDWLCRWVPRKRSGVSQPISCNAEVVWVINYYIETCYEQYIYKNGTNRLNTQSRALLDFGGSDPRQVTCLELFKKTPDRRGIGIPTISERRFPIFHCLIPPWRHICGCPSGFYALLLSSKYKLGGSEMWLWGESICILLSFK